MSKTQLRKPIEIKISTVVAVSAILRDADLNVLNAALHDMTGGAADYFDNEFAIIDIGGLERGRQTIDWAALIALFKTYSLNPVAVRNADDEMQAEILAHGLSIDAMAPVKQPVPQAEPPQSPILPLSEPVLETPALMAGPAIRNTMIVDSPVRAGQRIYAQACDLIVTAAVNNGAEVIADGSIHVYAPLRGRALAGASGNPDARIFSMSMEAELVSIAGIYRTFENGLPDNVARKSAQVRLVGDRLDLLAMNSATR